MYDHIRYTYFPETTQIHKEFKNKPDFDKPILINNLLPQEKRNQRRTNTIVNITHIYVYFCTLYFNHLHIIVTTLYIYIINPNSSPSFIEVDGSFITKPFDIANHFNDYFTGKVDKLRSEMTILNSQPSYLCIEGLIMKGKDCCFEFGQVCVEEVGKQLLSINNDMPPGIDNLDGKLLRMVADCIATPICNVFNPNLKERVHRR